MENQDSVLLKLAALFSTDPPFILTALPYKEMMHHNRLSLINNHLISPRVYYVHKYSLKAS